MKKIERRSFIKLGSAAVAGTIAAACAPAAAPAPAADVATAAPAATAAPVATAAPAPAATSVPEVAAPKFSESPMLAELVKAGKLPPVEERLPLNPKLINDLPPEWLTLEVGQYGGTIRLLGPAMQYDNDGYMMHETPLINTPGILGDNITPNVLESFESNADSTVFTAVIRKGLRWSDGAPATTKDVSFVVDDWWGNEELNPGGFPSWMRDGSAATGDPMQVDIVDDLTFTVTFKTPYGGFPVGLAIQSWHAYDVLMQPRHYLEQFHKTYADY